MTKYTPELAESRPGSPDTVFSYNASGDFELVLKSSLAGVLDIDGLPLITTADGGDKIAISDNGTESSMTLTNLANSLELLGIIGGGGGGGGGLLNLQTFTTPGVFNYIPTVGTTAILAILTGGGGEGGGQSGETGVTGDASTFNLPSYGTGGIVMQANGGFGGSSGLGYVGPGGQGIGGRGGQGSIGFVTPSPVGFGFDGQAGGSGFSESGATGTNWQAIGGNGGASFWGGGSALNGTNPGVVPYITNTPGSGGAGAFNKNTALNNFAGGGGGGGGTAIAFFNTGFSAGDGIVTIGAGGTGGGTGGPGQPGCMIILEFG